MGCLTAKVEWLNEPLSAKVTDITGRLKVRCGIVCSITEITTIIYVANTTLINNVSDLKNE